MLELNTALRIMNWRGSSKVEKSLSSKLMLKEQSKSIDKHLKEISCLSTHHLSRNYGEELEIELKQKPSSKSVFRKLFDRLSLPTIRFSSPTDWSMMLLMMQRTNLTLSLKHCTSRRSKSLGVKRLTALDKTL